MSSVYKPTIGLEVHAELKTKSKMFCGCPNDPDEKHPNINVCPICMAYPGTLPVINEEAVKKVILVGVALNGKIARQTNFDRKNYFYPDLPKGYQISQYKRPFCSDGFLEVDGKKIRINRIHLEEDTGRSQHDSRGDHSLVDFNRAGVPLMELVTEPDLTTAEEVKEFAEKLRLILRYLNASEASMEKGQLRVEVNISIREAGGGDLEVRSDLSKLGTKVEIKNLNSIKAAVGAVEYEIKRQAELLEEGKKVAQETRGWDEAGQKTFRQRLKESAHDYRYFPEPDLPVLNFDERYLEDIRYLMPELPEQRKERFKKQYGLNDAQIEIFTIAKHLGDYYEKVASELDVSGPKLIPAIETDVLAGQAKRLAANYIITEFPLLRRAQGMEIDDLEGFKIEPEAFAELMVMIFHQKLSSTAAKTVLKVMAETGLHPEAIAKEKKLWQVSDSGELEKAVREVLAKNPKAMEDYKNGKKEVAKFLIGQAMAVTKGQANPRVVAELLEKLLQ